jgi:hypothetical protein
MTSGWSLDDPSQSVPYLEVFGTDVGLPQTITPTDAGGFYVVDTLGGILSLPGGGGAASLVATLDYSLRGGAFLPSRFGPLAGQFLIVGGVAEVDTPAYASTMDDAFTITPYASQPGSLWSSAIVATGFGRYTGGVLVVNQGSGQDLKDGTVDFFAPDGSVTQLTGMPANVPYGGALAPQGFGDLGGNLLVSDALSGDIYAVNPNGRVRLFTTIPLGPDQGGLRQIAFAPPGWGRYNRHLFVSIDSGEVAVVDRKGMVVGKISGFAYPRGLCFTDIAGEPSLLIGDLGDFVDGLIWKAGPEDIVPVP